MLIKTNIETLKSKYDYLFLLSKDIDDNTVISTLSSQVLPSTDDKLVLSSANGEELMKAKFFDFVLEHLGIHNTTLLSKALDIKGLKESTLIDNLIVYEVSSNNNTYYVMFFAKETILNFGDKKFINNVWERFKNSSSLTMEELDKLKEDIVYLKSKYDINKLRLTLNKMNQVSLLIENKEDYKVFNKLYLLLNTVENGGFYHG